MARARASKKPAPRITPRDVLLVDAAGARVSRGTIVVADSVFPPVVLFAGEAFLLQPDAAGAGQLTYTRVRAYHADANFH